MVKPLWRDWPRLDVMVIRSPRRIICSAVNMDGVTTVPAFTSAGQLHIVQLLNLVQIASPQFTDILFSENKISGHRYLTFI